MGPESETAASRGHPLLLESCNSRMSRAIDTARRAAAAAVPVLLIGESGTGKHVLAAAIHEWSPRHAEPFTVVPRAALTEHRSEEALFAHLDDAGKPYQWLEATQRGTLFFEEVGELAPAEQAKLLRFLDLHQFEVGDPRERAAPDVHVIAGTGAHIETEVHAGRFRQDLFFRLSVVQIVLPPLRERLEDLPMLTEHFLARFTVRHQRGSVHLATDVQKALARYWWPGNIRELSSVLERMVVLSRGDTITAAELPDRLRDRAKPRVGAVPARPESLNELERHAIETAVKEAATLQEAATRLGIDPATLWRKRKRYGLT
jgi:NtrC-family two-component system response regulator AlgB